MNDEDMCMSVFENDKYSERAPSGHLFAYRSESLELDQNAS